MQFFYINDKIDDFIKQSDIINENNIPLEIKFLIHSELLSDQNNFVSGMKIDTGMIQYAHDFSVATFSKGGKLLSYQINGSQNNIHTGVIGGKDYIGMSPASSISYNLKKLKPGEEFESKYSVEFYEV